MAITGTGTSADPYVVTTWDELVAKASETGKYVKLGNDIDMNTEYPEGLETGFQIKCVEVDGDGKDIKNLYIKSGYFINNYGQGNVWKNTNFLNMVLGDGNNATYLYYDSGNFMNYLQTFYCCKFSGRLNGTSNNLSYLTRTSLVLNRCSINLVMNARAAITYYGSDFRYCKMQCCNVNLKGDTSQNQNMLLINSYVKGSLPNATISTTLFNGTKSVYSVLDIEAAEYTGSSGTNLVLANSDKCSTISQYLTSVTTAQLTNATYLDSIGFPIQT